MANFNFMPKGKVIAASKDWFRANGFSQAEREESISWVVEDMNDGTRIAWVEISNKSFTFIDEMAEELDKLIGYLQGIRRLLAPEREQNG